MGGQGGVGDGQEGFEVLGEVLGAAKGGCVGGCGLEVGRMGGNKGRWGDGGVTGLTGEEVGGQRGAQSGV